MPTGRVKLYDATRGFGFIQPHDKPGEDHFVHYKEVQSAGLEVLRVGQTIRYNAVPNRRRPGVMAQNLEVIEE